MDSASAVNTPALEFLTTLGHTITKDWLPRCGGRTPHEASPKRASRRGAALGDGISGLTGGATHRVAALSLFLPVTRQTFFRVRSFPSHFHSRGSLRAIPWFSGVSLHVVESREKPRKTLNLRVVAPTGFEPVFGLGHVFANPITIFEPFQLPASAHGQNMQPQGL